MPPAPGRLDWVDAGRGIAICLVVLFHTVNWLAAAGAEVGAWAEVNRILSSLRMPLFFVLSGLFAGKWLVASWRDLWTRKLRLFVWVFLLWTAIGLVAFMVGVRVMLGQGSVRGAVLTFLTGPVMPKLELWFIWALAIFFVLAKVTARVPPWAQLAVAATASAVALSGWETASPGGSGAVKYYAFFLAGVHGRAWVLRLGAEPRRLVTGGLFLAWAGVSLALWWWDLRDVPGLYFLNCVLGVGAGVVLSRVLTVGVLRRIGARTLPVYLTHTPVIMVVCSLLHVLGVTGHPGVDALLPPVVALGVVALSWRVGTPADGTPWSRL